MFKLAIVSRDHKEYERAFTAKKCLGAFENVELLWSGASVEGFSGLADVELILANPNIAAQFVHHCDKLRWLQSTWAGVKPLIDVTKRDYHLSGLKDVFGGQMREYVMAYILYFQRKIGDFGTYQQQKNWQQQTLPTLKGKRLGIMGLGNIGYEVAIAAKAFDMKVYSLNARSRPSVANQHFFLNDVQSFVQHCDVILNLLPHTDTTNGLCDKAFFEALNPATLFINAGRGNVIANDDDIVAALDDGRLCGAVLDVFKTEPLPSSHVYWETKNLLVTNHTAASSQHTLVWEFFEQNLNCFVNGGTPEGIINFERGY
ncbi:D-2-hydroxyacid dehydrogenase [Glaciecola sp. MH2013]|uniref:NAD(P)-dependent oxidoreductase n=1 Tax=Glaciecola sp. MH2013 TaxID=2785524 RepID=UPI00189FE10C|nr:NAD(P)-dependent oxidoreductase [Glaciecola sp. MH2013]MBF7074940.1 D-2-hydroxyacid dehydrogenase [Glaciecola sp. MH2013]